MNISKKTKRIVIIIILILLFSCFFIKIKKLKVKTATTTITTIPPVIDLQNNDEIKIRNYQDYEVGTTFDIYRDGQLYKTIIKE